MPAGRPCQWPVPPAKRAMNTTCLPKARRPPGWGTGTGRPPLWGASLMHTVTVTAAPQPGGLDLA